MFEELLVVAHQYEVDLSSLNFGISCIAGEAREAGRISVHATYSPEDVIARLAPLFAACGEISLVSLFGSCARRTMSERSDIDLLIWLDEHSDWRRNDVWNWFDSVSIPREPFFSRVSLIIRHMRPTITIDTLLLDLPEEHIVVWDRDQRFTLLKNAVENWRKKNGSYKIPSFNGRHVWKYSSNPDSTLSAIDFNLEISDVA